MTESTAVTDSIAPQSVLTFHDLTFVDEPGRPPLVGCHEVRHYVELDREGVLVVRMLSDQQSIATVTNHFTNTLKRNVDVLDLARELAVRGFVAAVDDVAISGPKVRRTHMPWVSQQRVAWLKHRRAWLVALTVISLGVLSAVLVPGARTSRGDVSFFGRPEFDMPLVLAGMLINTYVHELAHLFVARAHGVRGSIRFSTRLHIVVMETDVTNAWHLPRSARLQIFLAGLAYNGMAWAIATLLLTSHAIGATMLAPTTLAGIRLFAAINLVPIGFQTLFWIRTDLYYVLATLLGERNLRGDSFTYLIYRVRRTWLLWRSKDKLTCAPCGARVHQKDPECMRCGHIRIHGASFPPRRSRYRYVAYGAIVLVGVPLHNFPRQPRVFALQWNVMVRTFAATSRTLHAGTGIESAGMVFLTILSISQLALITWLVGRLLLMAISRLPQLASQVAPGSKLPGLFRTSRLAIAIIIYIVVQGVVAGASVSP